ncbi:DUF2878 domain-containing protein [Chromobacterium sphagni]|uniref:DUF2878 domain-containing protein n=1 Tax=Chromobacterium sphagni TaxID=1903179 RepID=A0A1S1WYG4_9NEIS|nr:DUF2878 domain-containing protein [Chromobacterium sphagni]OHX12179.1 hypothetical protein BI347_00700 [Chromobacterium sphagni]OHX21736.1 hypothetical protein BI344_04310 [Chromobacterium sphagni]
MRLPVRLALGGLAFNGWWLLLVWFRDHLALLTLAGALLAWEMLPRGLKARALALAAVGCLLDFSLAAAGLLRFVGVGALPLWMITLWLSFACWWLWQLQYWRPSGKMLMLLGALAGPASYYAGFRLQALQPGIAWYGLLPILGLAWGLWLPLASRLARKKGEQPRGAQ